MVTDDSKSAPKNTWLERIKHWLGLDQLLDRLDVFDEGRELKYQAKRTGLSFLAKRAAGFAGATIESGATVVSQGVAGSVGNVLQFIVGAELARNLGSVAGAIGGSIVGLTGLGLAAGVSASFIQMDYVHQKRNLTEWYRKELADRHGKSPDKVTVADLEKEAEHNHTIHEALRRARKQRNFLVPLAVVATLASFAVASFALPAMIAAAGLPALTGIAGFLAKTVIAMGAYYAVKAPLQAWGGHRFGLYDETPNDRIALLHRAHEHGETITPEQVLGALAAANPKIGKLVEGRTGKPFGQLTVQEQQQTAQALGDLLPLAKMAQDINDGTMRVTQLAFMAEGEFPVALPRETSTPPVPDEPELSIAQQVSANFRQRLGLSPKGEMSHSERIRQQQEQNPDPTISV